MNNIIHFPNSKIDTDDEFDLDFVFMESLVNKLGKEVFKETDNKIEALYAVAILFLFLFNDTYKDGDPELFISILNKDVFFINKE